MKSRSLKPQAINTGSMADIAFLLLIFFLVSTTIQQEKGLIQPLPPKSEWDQPAKIAERNLFKIQVNSHNQYLIRGELKADLSGLKSQLKAFVLNEGVNPSLSDNPEKAMVSIKADRGTEYHFFIAVLDEVKAAYYEIYGERVGLSASEYRQLDPQKPQQYETSLRGKAGIPMNISIANPD